MSKSKALAIILPETQPDQIETILLGCSAMEEVHRRLTLVFQATQGACLLKLREAHGHHNVNRHSASCGVAWEDYIKEKFGFSDDKARRLIRVSRCKQRGPHYKTISGTEWLGPDEPKIHWVICGGESGPHARPMHPDWARSLRDQCQQAGVPFHFKQWGEWSPYDRGRHDGSKLATPGSLDEPMSKFGKKTSGRLLDGREWNEFPSLEGWPISV